MIGRETVVERKCVKLVKVRGGRMPKWVAPGERGIPDRLMILPDRPLVFIEFKRSRGRIAKVQKEWGEYLEAAGHHHWFIFDVETFEAKLAELDANFSLGAYPSEAKKAVVGAAETEERFSNLYHAFAQALKSLDAGMTKRGHEQLAGALQSIAYLKKGKK